MVSAAAAALVLAGSPAVADQDRDRSPGFDHIVVIYQENHSFDNLYGLWGSVGGDETAGLDDAGSGTQVDQLGRPIGCLLQLDQNLVTTADTDTWLDGSKHPGPLAPACDGTTLRGKAYHSHFASSEPFAITDFVRPADHTCAPADKNAPNGVENGDPGGLAGGCTRDLVHRFYQEQYQLDGGRQDRYSIGSDSAGLTQGHYDTRTLPIYRYLHAPGHPNYVLADHFFEAAFGGSFINHQYLIAARAPEWDTGVGPVPAKANSQLDPAGFPNDSYPLYAPLPGTTYVDGPLTAVCSALSGPGVNKLPVDFTGRACGNFAVNTVQSSWQPAASSGTVFPPINDSDPAKPFYERNIGDELSAAGVSWKWFAGGWDNAAGNVGGAGWTNGSDGHSCTDPHHGAKAVYPNCADALFQFHHQPFNYFSEYAPGKPGRSHLADELEFLAAAKNGRLPAVSFVKPIGEQNEHPGYASTDSGEQHLVEEIKAVETGPQAAHTLIVVTYDEFGGQWDHVAPPGQGNDDGPHDAYGPGTRIPALLIGKPVARSGVDSETYDTTSILATIEHRWRVAPLGTRDAAVADLLPALRRGEATGAGDEDEATASATDRSHRHHPAVPAAPKPAVTAAEPDRKPAKESAEDAGPDTVPARDCPCRHED